MAQRMVSIVLSDAGRSVMKTAAPELEDKAIQLLYTEGTDETGLWVRVRREDGEHFVLVRWEFVLSLDFPVGEAKTVGLIP